MFNDNHITKDLTFRQLTNHEIHWNSWGTFGLNLIAGTKLDQKATSKNICTCQITYTALSKMQRSM